MREPRKNEARNARPAPLEARSVRRAGIVPGRLTEHRLTDQATIIACNLIYAMFPLALSSAVIGGGDQRVSRCRPKPGRDASTGASVRWFLDDPADEPRMQDPFSVADGVDGAQDLFRTRVL